MKAKVLAWRVAIAVAIVAIWEGGVRAKLFDPFFVSQPSDIAVRIAARLSAASLRSLPFSASCSAASARRSSDPA